MIDVEKIKGGDIQRQPRRPTTRVLAKKKEQDKEPSPPQDHVTIVFAHAQDTIFYPMSVEDEKGIEYILEKVIFYLETLLEKANRNTAM